jgi:hypothetical protein
VRYFWTFFWTFLLIQMLTYVTSQMSGTEFDFATGSILAVLATILLYIIPMILPNEPVEKH